MKPTEMTESPLTATETPATAREATSPLTGTYLPRFVDARSGAERRRGGERRDAPDRRKGGDRRGRRRTGSPVSEEFVTAWQLSSG